MTRYEVGGNREGKIYVNEVMSCDYYTRVPTGRIQLGYDISHLEYIFRMNEEAGKGWKVPDVSNTVSR